MEVSLTGEKTTLIILHKDAPGTIAAVTELVAGYGVNICNFRLSRESRGGQAVMTIEVDGNLGSCHQRKDPGASQYLFQHYAAANLMIATSKVVCSGMGIY